MGRSRNWGSHTSRTFYCPVEGTSALVLSSILCFEGVKSSSQRVYYGCQGSTVFSVRQGHSLEIQEITYHQCLAEKILFIAITQHQNKNSVAEAGQKNYASVALMVRPCFHFPAVPFVHIPYPFMQELKEGIKQNSFSCL